ncbi:hypothetical protein BDW74DRAFT_158723 [Aspergillus multicolor]|uniref:uncharacterized protein n=1 Tax=Aspergillus multicolor TaxID=41759 RepID=UPI003CCE19A9
MNPPAFLVTPTPPFYTSTSTSNSNSYPPKRNTRIPPILAAGMATTTTARPSNLNPNTNSDPNPSLPTRPDTASARLVTLSKQKLDVEASTPEPDLRRCLGHHSLLMRSWIEAQADMKRYLEDVLESDSDDDDDMYGDYDFGKGEVLFAGCEDVDIDMDGNRDVHTEVFECDDADDEDSPSVEEEEIVLPARSHTSVPAVSVSEVGTPVPRSTPASSSTPSSPVWMKEKLVGAVRGLVRRRNSTPSSLPHGNPPSPTPGTSPPAPPSNTGTSEPSTTTAKAERPSLTHMATKNASASHIPVHIHIHKHVSKPGKPLARSHSQGQLQTQTQSPSPAKSITIRGRQYAQRLGLKVAAAVPVAT